MGIKTQKVLRLISKIILILVGVGLIGIAGYYVYKSIAFKPQNVVVTNITDGSATVTWTTSSPMKGIVYVKKDKALLPGPLGIIGSGIAYDDRDVSDAQKACVDAFNKKASETKDSTFSVSGSNFDCENVKVTKTGSYYTHSVTMTNLDEKSTYNFVVGDGIWSFEESVSAVKTFSVLETVGEPMPVFGKITGDDGTYSSDAIVYITFNDGSESKDSIVYSSAVNDDGGWYVDASSVRDVNGNILPLELSNDTFRIQGTYSNYGKSDEQTHIFGVFEAGTFDITVKKMITAQTSLFNKLVRETYAGLASCNNCPSWMTPEIVSEIKAGVSDERAKELGYGNVLKVLSGGDGVLSVDEKKVLPTSIDNEYELNYVANVQDVIVTGSSGGGGSDDTFVDSGSGTADDTNRDNVVDVPGSPCNYSSSFDVCHDYGSKELACTPSGHWLIASGGQCNTESTNTSDTSKEDNSQGYKISLNTDGGYDLISPDGTTNKVGEGQIASGSIVVENLSAIKINLFNWLESMGMDAREVVKGNTSLQAFLEGNYAILKQTKDNTKIDLTCNSLGKQVYIDGFGDHSCPIDSESTPTNNLNPFNPSPVMAEEINSSSYALFLPEYGMYSFEIGNYTVSTQVADGKTVYLFYIESNGKDGFQIPADLNNPTSEEDIVLNSSASKITYNQKSTAQEYEIKKGINIVSFDFVPLSSDLKAYSAQNLIDQALRGNVEIKYISTFEGGRWSSGYSCSGKICTGENFSMVPGKGYLIFTNQAGKVTIPGYNLTSSVPVAFSAGWNLVGVHGYTTAYTARSFIDSINTIEGLTANNVSWWPTSKSKYEGVEVDNGTQYGLDFSISPNNGYFVRISKFAPTDTKCKSLIWNAGGSLNGTCGNTK